ncbi:unnamed protein product [Hydatigera taeniaeformis]|uniref:N-alpha-acetyltransferase 40 n=1 Tax=Hydatigena taeniaeformis TaxID=6205 RepID=A0A0R3WJB4_HYDTA|nr:unnamed protein product [Hydatigera taeniaeformis]
MSRISDVRTIVETANQFSGCELLNKTFHTDSYVTIDCCCCSFVIKCFWPPELTPNYKERIFSILEKNMKEFYMKSSWGWNGRNKFHELFSAESRLLLLKSHCDSVDTRRPVLYCYEIQLLEEVRGMKLGHKLLNVLYTIAANNQMTRVMLTVFKFNSLAHTFFTKNGFKTDISDPSLHGQSVDYSILSRPP